ncbi:PAS domain S-box protein [bacterium]|nr:PAS domain S-box protein [bacterium]
MKNNPKIQPSLHRSEIEEELRETNFFLRSILESSSSVSIISTDLDNRITYWNSGAENIFGYKAEEVVNKEKIDILYVEENSQQIIESIRSVVFAEKSGTNCEIPEVTKDGRILWIRMTLTPRFDSNGNMAGILGIGEDITKRKLAEESLRENEEKFRSVIEQSNDAIFILNNGQLDLVNRRFTELTGYSAQEVESPDFNFFDTLTPESRALVEKCTNLRKLGKNPSDVFEFTLIHKKGNKHYVQASVAEIDYQKGKAILVSLRDITEQKLLEEQFLQAQKMEGIGRLAGGVAHDFNNLLTIISGNSEIAKLTVDKKDPLNDDLDEIIKAANRAAELTQQLLAFSRKQKLQPKIINLNQVISTYNKMLRRIIGEDVVLTTNLTPDLSNVKADPGQINQIITNLVVNSRDAMPDGGKLKIETKNVELNEQYTKTHPGSKIGSYVLLSVNDSGIGMSREISAKIFQPFFTTKEIGKGTGLGLSTVYGIVKQSDGYIWCQSKLGKGTTFHIYLPVTEGEHEEIIQDYDTVALPKGKETILVVEDDEDVRNLAVKVLTRLGYKVIQAASGADALQLCKKMNKPVDLIVTDVIMPIMGGVEMVNCLREIWSDIKVLYMSGYTFEAIAHHGLINPEKLDMQKPLKPLVLAQEVRKMLDK